MGFMKWLFLFFLPVLAWGAPISEERLTTLYRSLDPQSIAQLFAFYRLYPESSQGKEALSDAWELMHKHRNTRQTIDGKLALPAMEIDGVIALVNKEPFEAEVSLSEEELNLIESLADHLANRELLGHRVWTKKDLFSLPTHEVDLSRALLLYQYEEDSLKIRTIEATLDLIALQILARLPKGASDEEKLREISHFIFHEKRFRFPPHSLWAKDIDTYTFLPSVLDSRKGVCLGVSILYLAIAERLDLPLEIITPPGHIFIRYHKGETNINIETTARGIDLPDRVYLGINTRKLQERNKKEVIGLALINQASVSWHKGEHETTVSLYEQALPYLPEDPLLKMLLGYNYLFVGKEALGKKLLEEIRFHTFDHAISKDTTPEDYLLGKVDAEGIQTIFQHVDETRHSILEKQAQLKKVLKKHPNFRDGILQLAITYLQLGRGQEALETLSRYHDLDPTSPTVEYYLAIVKQNRFLYKEAWEHLHTAETLTLKRNHSPYCLKGLRNALRPLYPDPKDKAELFVRVHGVNSR